MATLPPGLSPTAVPFRPDPRVSQRGQPIIQTRSDADARAQYERRVQQDRYICDLAHQRFQAVERFEGVWRTKALKCLKFRAGEQWEAAEIYVRTSGPNPRPCLTINQTGKFIRQITNAEQQNRPAGKTRPVGSGADVETASVFDGLIRAILQQSDWDTVVDTAFDGAVTHGKGYIRVLTDYESPWSFQQVLRLERILNPFAVYLDPAGRRTPDYHTAEWGLVVERMNRAQVCERYEIPRGVSSAWASTGDGWVSRDEALLVDYYYREALQVQLVQLSSGETRYVPIMQAQDELTEDEQAQEAALLSSVAWEMLRYGVTPLLDTEAGAVQQQRRSELPIIRACKLVGDTIVERSIWPSRYLPIVPVIGDEIDLNGEVEYRGVVWDMIDAQRAYNYWTTTSAETVALAPKSSYIGTVKQFQNRPEWANANTVAYSYLAYNPDFAPNGQLMPPPQRQTAEPAIQAIALARQQAQQDLYNTTGLTPADLGEPSNDTSGRHAEIRRNESEMGSSHYAEHLRWAVRHVMRILVDAIPRVYREPDRVLRILGKDDSVRQIMLHPDPQARQAGLQELQAGVEGIYNLSVGTYDVVADVGANYKTQRQDAVENLIKVAETIPALGAVIPDLIVGNMDFDDAKEAARRAKLTLPPGMLQDDEGQKPEDLLPVVMQRLQQKTQEAQALNAHASQVEQVASQATQENQQLKQDRMMELREIQLKEREVELQATESAMKARQDMAMLEMERDKMLMSRRQDAHTAVGNVAGLMRHLQQMREQLAALEAEEREEGEGNAEG